MSLFILSLGGSSWPLRTSPCCRSRLGKWTIFDLSLAILRPIEVGLEATQRLNPPKAPSTSLSTSTIWIAPLSILPTRLCKKKSYVNICAIPSCHIDATTTTPVPPEMKDLTMPGFPSVLTSLGCAPRPDGWGFRQVTRWRWKNWCLNIWWRWKWWAHFILKMVNMVPFILKSANLILNIWCLSFWKVLI